MAKKIAAELNNSTDKKVENSLSVADLEDDDDDLTLMEKKKPKPSQAAAVLECFRKHDRKCSFIPPMKIDAQTPTQLFNQCFKIYNRKNPVGADPRVCPEKTTE